MIYNRDGTINFEKFNRLSEAEQVKHMECWTPQQRMEYLMQNTISEEEIINMIKDEFDLTPRGIINYLDLQRPIYRQTTNYGHFGKENLPWEKIIDFYKK